MSEPKPLVGRRIAVTRATEHASDLSNTLTLLGAEVLELPLIRVTKSVDLQGLADVLVELGGYDWIVFTSANGVRYFFEEFHRVFDDIRSLGLLRFAAVGDATAQEIAKHHIKIECQPKIATAEALADALIAHCREHLAHFKCPREIRFEELPKTSTGKIQKHLLRAKVRSASAIG